MSWKVEHRYTYGWDDAGWMINDQPMRFESQEEGNREVDEFIADTEAAAGEGDFEPYRREDYRVVPAED